MRDGVEERDAAADISFKQADLSTTAIIGIGSPQAGDDLGWRVIDQLQQNPSIALLQRKGLSLFRLERPGVSLQDRIRPYEHVLIVDAMKSGEETPSYICLDAARLMSGPGPLSSHGIGVVELLALLESLAQTPKQIVVCGISRFEEDVIENIIQLF